MNRALLLILISGISSPAWAFHFPEQRNGRGVRCSRVHIFIPGTKAKAPRNVVVLAALENHIQAVDIKLHNMMVIADELFFALSRPSKKTIEAMESYQHAIRRRTSEHAHRELQKALLTDPFFGQTTHDVRATLEYYLSAPAGAKDHMSPELAMIVTLTQHWKFTTSAREGLDLIATAMKKRWILEQFVRQVNGKDSRSRSLADRDVQQGVVDFNLHVREKFGSIVSEDSFQKLRHNFNPKSSEQDLRIMNQMAEILRLSGGLTSANELSTHLQTGLIQMHLRRLVAQMGLSKDFPIFSFFEYFHVAQEVHAGRDITYDEFLIKLFAPETFSEYMYMKEIAEMLDAVDRRTLDAHVESLLPTLKFGF